MKFQFFHKSDSQKIKLRTFLVRNTVLLLLIIAACLLSIGTWLAHRISVQREEQLLKATVEAVASTIKSDLEFGDLWAVRRTLSPILATQLLSYIEISNETTGERVLSLPYRPEQIDLPIADEHASLISANNGNDKWLLKGRKEGVETGFELSEEKQILLAAVVLTLFICGIGIQFLANRVGADLSAIDRAIATLEDIHRSEVGTSKVDDVLTFEASRSLIQIGLTRLRLLEAFESERQLAVQSAIARTTQMLAHDVRKPFALLNMALDVLMNVEPSEFKKVAELVLPEVQQAMLAATGMIQDVMEVNASSELFVEEVGFGKTLRKALANTSLMFPEHVVQIEYQFNHSLKMRVDEGKVQRVLANLLSNAIQATGKNGKMWIRTRNIENNTKLEVCIGNFGPYISNSVRSKLFEEFYTHGKKGGTGLGLAISKKIVLAHGGSIWCVSEEGASGTESVVEFYFTLPAGGEDVVSELKLPSTSQDFRSPLRDL